MLSSDRVCGGYFITRKVERQPWMSQDLLPEKLVTLSGCIAPFLPGSWAFSWAQHSDEERQAERARFDLDEHRAAALTSWAEDAINSNILGWPSVIYDLSVARRVRDELVPDLQDAVILGVSLEASVADRYKADAAKAGGDPGGLYHGLERAKPVEPGGRILGFDVLGLDCWPVHSYLCNGLEKRFGADLGVRPNSHGLIDDAQVASRCAALANDPATGAEPVLWLPCEVHLFS